MNFIINKKLNIISFILVVFSFYGYSQINFGFKSGLNYGLVKGNIDPPNADYFDNALGFRLGLSFQYRLGRVKFGTGCLLSFRPTCAKYSFFKKDCGTLHFTFIEVPLSIYHSFLENKIELGFSAINGFTKYPPISLIGDKEYEIDLEFILGWNINNKFNIELSYLIGGLDPLLSDRDTHLYYVGNLSLNYTFYHTNNNKSKK